MSAPLAPSQVKDKIPGVNVNFCEKYVRSLGLGKDVYNLVNYFFKEDGTFTDEFIADWCLQATCNQTGGGGSGTGLKVDATDGLSDHILVTWGPPVPGALAYDLYRANTDNFSQASIVGDSLTAQSYDDTVITTGTFYYYWVRAKSATTILATSASDRGYAGTLSATLPPVTDLLASKGFNFRTGAFISLVWTPVPGASAYDIYRNSLDDWTTANLIEGNRTPYDNSEKFTTGDSPKFVDNGGELVYFHDPGGPVLPFESYFTKFYFWVVARRSQPTAISRESNSAVGWSSGFGDGVAIGGGPLASDVTGVTVPANTSKLHLSLRGSGAGGAGGGPQFGGGAGGGPVTIVGWVAVTPGSKFRVVSAPPTAPGSAPSETNGNAGSVTKVQYSQNGLFTDTVDLMTANSPGGGIYNGAGGGAGGAGASGTVHVSVNEPFIFDGRPGKPGDGRRGGRSGNAFGSIRFPGAHFNGFNPLTSYDGLGGSGSYGSASAGAYATGGNNGVGSLVYNFET